MNRPTFRLELATERDLGLILRFIRELGAYEQLAHEVTATEEELRETLFGSQPVAEVVIAYAGDEPAGFAAAWVLAGYVLAQAVVPVQEVNDGVVEIRLR